MNELVRRQMLQAAGAFDIALDAAPSRRRVRAACEAAKLLRNRVLRERARAAARIDTLRQQQLYDEDDEHDDDGADNAAVGDAARPEYVYMSELAIAPQRVVPLLLAHGPQHSETLLPQLLKLLVALLQPPLRFAADEMAQRDAHTRLAARCASNEFVALLLQCAAPVTARRARGVPLQRDDAVLLELTLTTLVHLLDSSDRAVAACVVSAIVRNHAIDFLLVVLTQNHKRMCGNRDAAAVVTCSEDDNDTAHGEAQVVLGDSDEDSDGGDNVLVNMEQQYAARVRALLEGDEQLWKWTRLVVAALAGVLACMPRRELAELQVTNDSSRHDTVDATTCAVRRVHDAQLRACARERDDWRRLARSRNGAMHSTALVVRGDRAAAAVAEDTEASHGGTVALGAVSTLLSARHSRDALAAVRALDVRKRGRWVRGMYESTAPRSDVDLHTGTLLARQVDQLLRLGLAPLDAMAWPHVRRIVDEVDRATSEYAQLRRERQRDAAATAIGDDADGCAADATAQSAVLTAALYEELATVLHYLRVCTAALAALRAGAAMAREAHVDGASTPQRDRWRSVSCLVDVAHVQLGFTLLRSCMRSRDVRRRLGVDVVVTYLAEALMAVHMLLTRQHNGLPNASELALAAHALASVTLYREDNIRVVFELLSPECVARDMPVARAQACVQLVHVVFDLMERCSYDGALLLLPARKRPRPSAHDDTAPPATTAEAGDDTAGGGVEHAHCDNDDDDAHSLAATTAASTHAERVVAISGYVRRLALPHGGVALLYSALERWRLHDADVNLALVHLLEALVQHGCACVCYNVAFLLVMHDVLAHAAHTHAPLYRICDRLVYDFFNPPYALAADACLRARLAATADASLPAVRGALSHRGFEVALRCSRALFNLSATDYTLLEEKGMPHLAEHTALPLAHEHTPPARSDDDDEASAHDVDDGDALAAAIDTT